LGNDIHYLLVFYLPRVEWSHIHTNSVVHQYCILKGICQQDCLPLLFS
jgi:hypothetical protein